MSSINEIVERIAVANAESRRINEERNINIGKRETLTKQLNTAIEKYKNDYGVSLTAETLEAEVTRVIQAKEAEVKNIETMLSLIKEGRYVEAEQIVNPQPQVQPEVSVSAPTSISEPVPMPSPVVPEPAPVPMPSPVMPEPAPVSMPSPVAPVSPVMSEPVAPVMPEPVVPVMSEPVAPSPVAPPPVNTSGIAALNGFSAPQQEAPVAPPEPTPAPPVSPVAPSAPTSPTSPTMENVTSFSAILGGSSFQL